MGGVCLIMEQNNLYMKVFQTTETEETESWDSLREDDKWRKGTSH